MSSGSPPDGVLSPEDAAQVVSLDAVRDRLVADARSWAAQLGELSALAARAERAGPQTRRTLALELASGVLVPPYEVASWWQSLTVLSSGMSLHRPPESATVSVASRRTGLRPERLVLLSRLFVAPEARGKGLARPLLHAALAEAHGNGNGRYWTWARAFAQPWRCMRRRAGPASLLAGRQLGTRSSTSGSLLFPSRAQHECSWGPSGSSLYLRRPRTATRSCSLRPLRLLSRAGGRGQAA